MGANPIQSGNADSGIAPCVIESTTRNINFEIFAHPDGDNFYGFLFHGSNDGNRQ